MNFAVKNDRRSHFLKERTLTPNFFLSIVFNGTIISLLEVIKDDDFKKLLKFSILKLISESDFYQRSFTIFLFSFFFGTKRRIATEFSRCSWLRKDTEK